MNQIHIWIFKIYILRNGQWIFKIYTIRNGQLFTNCTVEYWSCNMITVKSWLQPAVLLQLVNFWEIFYLVSSLVKCGYNSRLGYYTRAGTNRAFTVIWCQNLVSFSGFCGTDPNCGCLTFSKIIKCLFAHFDRGTITKTKMRVC